MIDSLYLPFKNYSDGGSVYVFSDTHFEDDDCKLMNKDWVTPREQINILKRTCHRNDTLILLGDVGNPEWLLELDCYIVLILGNHDRGKKHYEPYVDEIYEGPLIIAPKIILSHEPLNTPYMLNIHGHCHNGDHVCERKIKMKDFDSGADIEMSCYCINVAADVVGYTPISLKNIINSGYLKRVKDIHRVSIDRQINKKRG